MRYTLFLHYPEMTVDELGEEGFEAGKAAFHAYTKALDDAGVLVSAEVLQPSGSSTTLTVRDGRARVQDGPYADTKEQIGGTFGGGVAQRKQQLSTSQRSRGGSVQHRRPVFTLAQVRQQFAHPTGRARAVG